MKTDDLDADSIGIILTAVGEGGVRVAVHNNLSDAVPEEDTTYILDLANGIQTVVHTAPDMLTGIGQMGRMIIDFREQEDACDASLEEQDELLDASIESKIIKHQKRMN